MKRARVLATTLWVLFVAALVGAAYLGMSRPQDPISLMDALWASSFLGFPTAGLLIVRRLPERPLGWIFLIAPLLLMFGVFCSEVAQVESGAWYAWIANVMFSAGMVLFAFVPLLLPAGNLASPRWRFVAASGAVAAVTWVASAMFAPGPLAELEGSMNPVGIPALGGFFAVATAIVGPMIFAVPILGILSLVVRARRLTGTERQQVKWLAFGGATILLSFAGLWAVERLWGDLSDAAATPFTIVAILAFPVTMAIAMLRHRLYDIDVVINRALVYGALTGILASAYLATVVVLQGVLQPLTRDSDLAVAASTLAMAALFRPLRSRVQSFIDRRFYRKRYDASETLREFSVRLRDQVNLESVKGEVVDVVARTVQPVHTSLWLRSEAGSG